MRKNRDLSKYIEVGVEYGVPMSAFNSDMKEVSKRFRGGFFKPTEFFRSIEENDSHGER